MARMLVGWRIVAVATGAIYLTGCLPAPGTTPPPINVADGLVATYVVADADYPAGIAATDDGRVFYTEKETGHVRVVVDGELQTQPFATVPVNYAGDRGLLGIALHPQFDLKPRVYVFYTRSDTGLSTDNPAAVVDNRVVYFDASENVSPTSEVFVASLPAGTQTVHVGGQLAFAYEGHLFVTLGDLGNKFNASNPDRLAGKLLRYNDDGTIPADNPIADSPVWAWGFRNPGGLTIDPTSFKPFVIDRNADQLHEVNRVDKGQDFGYPAVEGLATTDEELAYAAEHPEYVDPILDSGTDRSPFVGLDFNPSTRYGPSTQLQMYYGSRDDTRVYQVQLVGDRTAVNSARLFATGFPGPITSLHFTPAGALYVAVTDAVLRVDLFTTTD